MQLHIHIFDMPAYMRICVYNVFLVWCNTAIEILADSILINRMGDMIIIVLDECSFVGLEEDLHINGLSAILNDSTAITVYLGSEYPNQYMSDQMCDIYRHAPLDNYEAFITYDDGVAVLPRKTFPIHFEMIV